MSNAILAAGRDNMDNVINAIIEGAPTMVANGIAKSMSAAAGATQNFSGLFQSIGVSAAELGRGMSGMMTLGSSTAAAEMTPAVAIQPEMQQAVVTGMPVAEGVLHVDGTHEFHHGIHQGAGFAAAGAAMTFA